MLFQHRFFVWKFSLREKQTTIKDKLSFQSMSIGEFVLLKLNRPCLRASNFIISTKTWRKTPISKYILKNNAGCYWNRNPSHVFVRFISISFPRVLRNCRWWSHFFTKTQSYSPQNSTKHFPFHCFKSALCAFHLVEIFYVVEILSKNE